MSSSSFDNNNSETAVFKETQDYDETLKVLETLILTRPVQERAKDVRNTCNVEAMRDYVKRLNLDLSKLKFIHVAGTKGKGSTCAFCESILRNTGLKTGLYTSPHLIDVRERIRINGKPVGKQLFVKQFWDCWKGLESTRNEMYPSMATYFRFLTLIAFKTFIEEKVDVVVMEVGVGGRLDATNVITPQVCGISSIGWDHVDILGDTLEKIAFEKAGIMKPNVPVITYHQTPEVMQVFQNHAQKVGAKLFFAPPLELFTVTPFNKQLQLGLVGNYQMQNASLALALCAEFWKSITSGNNQQQQQQQQQELALKKPILEPVAAPMDQVMNVPLYKPFVISEQIFNGLARCRWPCRGQLVPIYDRNLLFFIDGAHTPESLELSVNTFNQQTANLYQVSSIANSIQQDDVAGVSSDDDDETSELSTLLYKNKPAANDEKQAAQVVQATSIKKVLVFYYTGNRDPEGLLKQLYGQDFDQVIFCLSDSQHSVLNKRNITTMDQKIVEDNKGNKERQKLDVLKNLWISNHKDDAKKVQEVLIIEKINHVLEHIWQLSAENAQKQTATHVLITGSFYLAGDTLRKLIKVHKYLQKASQ